MNYLLGDMDGREKQRRDCFSAARDLGTFGLTACERAEPCLMKQRAFLSRDDLCLLDAPTYDFLDSLT